MKKNLKKGIELLEQAADKGDPDAMHSLAVKYEEGEGVPKNLQTAFLYYKRAVDFSTVSQIQRDLAECYLKGTGTPVDRAEAIRLYRLAAAQGDAQAAKALKDLGA